MKWKTPVKPNEGAKKTVKRFAFLPKKLTNGFTIWFEFYYSHQHYSNYYGKWVELWGDPK